jgi:hypothetical protein
MDWTVFGVGALTAAAAIGAQVVQALASARREEQNGRQRGWEARRDVYIELLKQVDQLNAIAEGAAATGTGHLSDKDVVRPYSSAVTKRPAAPVSAWIGKRAQITKAGAKSDDSLSQPASSTGPALDLWPVPDQRLPKVRHRRREVGVAPSPVVDQLGSGRA